MSYSTYWDPHEQEAWANLREAFVSDAYVERLAIQHQQQSGTAPSQTPSYGSSGGSSPYGPLYATSQNGTFEYLCGSPFPPEATAQYSQVTSETQDYFPNSRSNNYPNGGKDMSGYGGGSQNATEWSDLGVQPPTIAPARQRMEKPCYKKMARVHSDRGSDNLSMAPSGFASQSRASPTVTNVGPIKCHYDYLSCPKRFYDKQGLERHLFDRHGGSTKVRCAYCDAGPFEARDTYQHHIFAVECGLQCQKEKSQT